MKRWLHRLAHKLCLTSGWVDHEKDAKGEWWVGLRCSVCGELMYPIKSAYQDSHDAALPVAPTTDKKP